MIIAIDIGNTKSKIAVFGEDGMTKVWRFETENLKERLGECLDEFSTFPHIKVGWMSVARDFDIKSWEIWMHDRAHFSFFHIHNTETLPIENAYHTPKTLGIDRIVAVIGAKSFYPDDPVLVVDAGTALTYDFATADHVYLGGGISPGIHMRFKALHTFTAKLPLIEEIKETPIVGRSTFESMSSGVLNGVLAEVEGICRQYKKIYGDTMKLLITGGDTSFFENHLKSVNFADENLTLIGIYHIILKSTV